MIAIKVMGVSSENSVSDLLQYISTETKTPGSPLREIFGQNLNGLKPLSARRYLTRHLPGQAGKRDFFHFVVSPKADAFRQINHDQKQAYKEVTRQMMQEIEKDVGAKELRWVAAIHLNTEIPHVHVLVHKDFEDKDGNRHRFHRLPGFEIGKTAFTKLLGE